MKKIGPYILNQPTFGDAFELINEMPDESVDCVIASPTYWDPQLAGRPDLVGSNKLGYEKTNDIYVDRIVHIFKKIFRVLKQSGVAWLIIGDVYFKEGLLGIPWGIASQLPVNGWTVSSEIIWNNSRYISRNPRRPVRCNDTAFMLTKSVGYYYTDVIGGNIVSYMSPYVEGATCNVLSPDLVRDLVWAGCPKNGVVLAPFLGSGMIGKVCNEMERDWVGFEINDSDRSRKLIEKLTGKRDGS